VTVAVPRLDEVLRPVAPQVLGVLVRRHGQFEACEDAVQEAAQRQLGGAMLEPGLLCLLAWLVHVSQSLTKSPQYGANPVWVRRNLRSVVERAPDLLRTGGPVVPAPARPVEVATRQ
jgi:hypothetical protein